MDAGTHGWMDRGVYLMVEDFFFMALASSQHRGLFLPFHGLHGPFGSDLWFAFFIIPFFSYFPL